MAEINAIIPVKLTNERLPGKNLMQLGDRPLMHYIIETLHRVKEIDQIYVCCSSDAILDYLPSYAQLVIRPANLDSNDSNFTDIFSYISGVVSSDIYVYAHATAPFVSASTIQRCLQAIMHDGHDSAYTATVVQDFLWTECGSPLGFDPQNIPRSQDLPKFYRETSGIYAFESNVFMKYKRRVGPNAKAIVVSDTEAIDINTIHDFEEAQRVVLERERID